MLETGDTEQTLTWAQRVRAEDRGDIGYDEETLRPSFCHLHNVMGL